jgi:hypothetical protein
MKGEYRFRKVQGGRMYFARVEVEVVPCGDAVAVVNGLPETADPDAGEVRRGLDPSWEEAALDGIRIALGWAGYDGSQAEPVLKKVPLAPLAAVGSGSRAVLLRLVGTLADTRPDVIRCAAALATWRALGAAGPEPEFSFDGRLWSLSFRAAQPAPSEGAAR